MPDKNISAVDGALDTLGSILRTMGSESFPLENDRDTASFPASCAEFASHVENGSAVPSFDVEQSPAGTRAWSQLLRFYVDRRHAEKSFVTDKLQDYRGIVEDLVGGLRQIGQRDQNTESSIMQSLTSIEKAVLNGTLPEIKHALGQTISHVSETFAQQKREYEKQISEMNDRMSNLRQDLHSAHEEMKLDSLTGAFNRGAFDTTIKQSLNMHFILDRPVTLMLIDVDSFKQVNDSYGHTAGDEVLRSISEALERSFIRKGDLVARFGGDEFAVILNDTSAQNSTRLIRQFMAYVREIAIPTAPADERVSCSAGYTEIHAGDTVESLINRADKALYQAKSDGRNLAKYIPPQEKWAERVGRAGYRPPAGD